MHNLKRFLFIFSILFCLMIGFQNCGEGFQGNQSNVSLGSEGLPVAPSPDDSITLPSNEPIQVNPTVPEDAEPPMMEPTEVAQSASQAKILFEKNNFKIRFMDPVSYEAKVLVHASVSGSHINKNFLRQFKHKYKPLFNGQGIEAIKEEDYLALPTDLMKDLSSVPDQVKIKVWAISDESLDITAYEGIYKGRPKAIMHLAAIGTALPVIFYNDRTVEIGPSAETQFPPYYSNLRTKKLNYDLSESLASSETITAVNQFVNTTNGTIFSTNLGNIYSIQINKSDYSIDVKKIYESPTPVIFTQIQLPGFNGSIRKIYFRDKQPKPSVVSYKEIGIPFDEVIGFGTNYNKVFMIGVGKDKYYSRLKSKFPDYTYNFAPTLNPLAIGLDGQLTMVKIY